MQNTITIPTCPKRKFVPEKLIINSWDKIKFLFDNLVEREISLLLNFTPALLIKDP